MGITYILMYRWEENHNTCGLYGRASFTLTGQGFYFESANYSNLFHNFHTSRFV